MAISASLVKELRERTGAGMMECKRALQDVDGDIEAAIEAMRKSGQAKAAKKAGRIAADGVVCSASPMTAPAASWWRSTARRTSSPRTRTSSASPRRWVPPRSPASAPTSPPWRRAAADRGRHHRGRCSRGTHRQGRRERPAAPVGALRCAARPALQLSPRRAHRRHRRPGGRRRGRSVKTSPCTSPPPTRCASA
jgi:hypothetical protein